MVGSRGWKAAAVVALAALLTVGGGAASVPVTAIGSTTISDGPGGVDYDAACVAQMPLGAPVPNSITSPQGQGCVPLSRYDGSTFGTDVAGVGLASNTAGQLVATVTVGQTLPAAGNTNRNALDLPLVDFLGATYYVLFQNRTKQTNTPTPTGGCPRIVPPNDIVDQPASWKDGYHFFVAFEVVWDGQQWVHSAKVGVYDPSPTGGFVFTELGTDDGSGWHDNDPYMVHGVDWNASVSGATATVTLEGVVSEADGLCAGGVFRTEYAATGDVIANVKGLSTANATVTLPVALSANTACALLSFIACGDLRAVGGFALYSDTTTGTSTSGLFGTNITNVAYTTGLVHYARGGGTVLDALVSPERVTDERHGAANLPDTLGPGPTCPTPTFGGTVPPNLLFVPDASCHVDDDLASKGSVLPEFWSTSFGFTF